MVRAVFLALLIVPLISASSKLRVRVDDDMTVYQNGNVLINTHDMPGWQWKLVYEGDLDDSVLVMTAYNQGGPGGILLTIDDEYRPVDEWKCAPLDTEGQDPESKYPGSLDEDFDDSEWDSAISVNNAWGNTEGFPGDQSWFWGVSSSERSIVCRLRLLQTCTIPKPEERSLKIRVDDDVAVYQGNQAVINSHIIPGWQWTTVYDATINTNLIVLTAFNQGGPGGVLLELDGQVTSVEDWKCNTMSSQSQDPEEAYPGVFELDFDDSAWQNAVSVNNAWGNTVGFSTNDAWFWAQPTSAKMIICRMRLAQCSNLALDKPAYQSSIGWSGAASRAVDGNTNGHYFSGSCSHTQNDQNAWWAVDTGYKSAIKRVTISNRQDCCANRLANFVIGTTNKNPETGMTEDNLNVCHTEAGSMQAGETRAFPCEGVGRYVVIMLKGRNYLTLCDVEVN